MHIIKMVKRYRRGFQQGGAGDAVREITLGERFGANKQVVQRAKFIHQTAWQRLMLDTHRTDHFTTTQTFLGARFILNLQVQPNR